MTATDGDETRKPLGESTPWTGHLSAEGATNLQMQEDLRPSYGHVSDRASVGTIHRHGAVVTARTRG